MAEFAYSLLSETFADQPSTRANANPVLVEDFSWLRSTADEIHDYCRADGPLLIVPNRAQRFMVLRTEMGWPRYPLVGDPERVYYREDGVGSATKNLTSGEDYQIIEDGRLLEFAREHIGRRIQVVGDAGWGFPESLGSLAAELASDVTLLPAASLSIPGAGSVLRIDDELLLVTAAEDNGNWPVSRGIAGTSRVQHAASAAVMRIRTPELLEAAARGIANSLKVRESEPGRGVSRPVQVQDGFRLVRTDPLAAFRRDLEEYRR